jgi:cytochrome P450
MTERLVLKPSFTQNPHAVLHRLRTEAPVSRAIMWGGVPVWLITRYDDAKALLVDPRLSKDRAAALALFPPNYIGTFDSELTSGMLHTDHQITRDFESSSSKLSLPER